MDEPYLLDPELPDCPKCHGNGEIPVDSPTNYDDVETCPACGGSGFIDPPDLYTDDE